ncbi:hypothetical protein N7457_004047 [Penicillium paradoxum]|uniref:uncharacterized protein n=1 Tax=Penicillium paradoxum TaxID=176176 RepID=UPI00254665D3|nr:uncharacterized protein N7457_004047 [Penicillium paradoxum]KAJ5782273.1 hypothetical protein N7457_004047 [Penicillium paradoxum]
MDFDHLAEKKQEQKATAWLKLWSSRDPGILSMDLAKKHRPGKAVSACLWKSGMIDDPDVIVRFAALGRAILRREKVQIEVATMRLLRYLFLKCTAPVSAGQTPTLLCHFSKEYRCHDSSKILRQKEDQF